MQARDHSKLATTRVTAVLKVGAMVAVLGLIVIMIERPMIFAAGNEAGTVLDEVSFVPNSPAAADRADAQRAGDNTGEQLAASKRLPLPWNFAAPGAASDSQPATF